MPTSTKPRAWKLSKNNGCLLSFCAHVQDNSKICRRILIKFSGSTDSGHLKLVTFWVSPLRARIYFIADRRERPKLAHNTQGSRLPRQPKELRWDCSGDRCLSYALMEFGYCFLTTSTINRRAPTAAATAQPRSEVLQRNLSSEVGGCYPVYASQTVSSRWTRQTVLY